MLLRVHILQAFGFEHVWSECGNPKHWKSFRSGGLEVSSDWTSASADEKENPLVRALKDEAGADRIRRALNGELRRRESCRAVLPKKPYSSIREDMLS